MTDFDDLKKELEDRRNRTDVVGRVPSGLKQATLGQVRQRPPPLAVHATRPQQGTQVGLAPPGPGNKLPPPRVPLVAPELDSTLESPRPEPRKFSPPPFASPQEEQAIEREAIRSGDTVDRPQQVEITPIPSRAPIPGVPASVVAKAERIPLAKWLIIVAAAGTGGGALIAALGQAVTSVIVALRPPTNTELRAEFERKLNEQTEAFRARVELEATARRGQLKDAETVQLKTDARLDKLEAEPRAQMIQGLPTK